MNSLADSPELREILESHRRRMEAVSSGTLQIGVIEHDMGHIQQALLNIVDGIGDGSMSEERAIQLMQSIGLRLDGFSQSLWEAPT